MKETEQDKYLLVEEGSKGESPFAGWRWGAIASQRNPAWQEKKWKKNFINNVKSK